MVSELKILLTWGESLEAVQIVSHDQRFYSSDNLFLRRELKNCRSLWMVWECVQPFSIPVLFDKLEILHRTVTDQMIDKHCWYHRKHVLFKTAKKVAN